MAKQDLRKAIALPKRVGHVFVATADAKGLPHVAAASQLTLRRDGRVAVAAWFCPGTVNNLQENQHIALVVWDPRTDTGHHILGQAENVEETAVLDGYTPVEEKRGPVPQVRRQILVRPQKLLAFTHAPHSDQEE